MKRIIRLTESDLARIVKRVIKENDDYKDRSMYDSYYSDDEEQDEELGQTDRGEEELQELIEEARDFLENECGYDIEEINSMDEFDIVEALYADNNEDLADEIEKLLNQEGFYNADEDEPYDSIGGHSVNDLKKAFTKTKGRDGELGEGWDDFIQKKRYPEDYKRENYRKLPKDALKSGSKIDREGTIITKRREDPFDEYEDFDGEEYA